MPDRADVAHNKTESLLIGLEVRLRQMYRKASKNIQKEIEPLLSEIWLDSDTATQKQRLDYAEKHNLQEIADIFADYMTEVNEKAIKDINRTLLSVYGVNFEAMAQFFEDKAGVDIANDD